MNIIDNRAKFNLTAFSELKVGDCFEYNDCVYLKTDGFCEFRVCDIGENVYCNAINLNNNCFCFFFDSVVTRKIDATLSIEYSMEG